MKVLVELMFRIFEFLDEIIENQIEVDSEVVKNFELFLKNGAERIEKFLLKSQGFDLGREKTEHQMKCVLEVLKKERSLDLAEFRSYI